MKLGITFLGKFIRVLKLTLFPVMVLYQVKISKFQVVLILSGGRHGVILWSVR